MRTRLAVIAALALTATGCSGDDNGDTAEGSQGAPAPATAMSEYPACEDVWVDGETLPEDYEGCDNGGTIEAAASIECDSGSGVFVTYQDQFHALLGGEITEAASSSEEYAAAYEECFADS